MERLTEKYFGCIQIKECGNKICSEICEDHEISCDDCPISEAFDKLAKYEDLEENRELIRKQDLINYIKKMHPVFKSPELYHIFNEVAAEFSLDGGKQ